MLQSGFVYIDKVNVMQYVFKVHIENRAETVSFVNRLSLNENEAAAKVADSDKAFNIRDLDNGSLYIIHVQVPYSNMLNSGENCNHFYIS